MNHLEAQEGPYAPLAPPEAARERPPTGSSSCSGAGPSHLPTLVLSALGVVYGDIGTSPLYALRECFSGLHAVDVTAANVLGVLSLTTWSLILVVSVKYLVLILRADNQGEGGILALMALAVPPATERRGSCTLLLLRLA